MPPHPLLAMANIPTFLTLNAAILWLLDILDWLVHAPWHFELLLLFLRVYNAGYLPDLPCDG